MLVLLAGVRWEASAQAGREWRVYLVPFSHTDVGYTGTVASVLAAQQRYIDTAMAYCYRSAAGEPGSRFKWTVEVTWPLEAYCASRSPARVESLMTLVRGGAIEIGAMHFGLQTDLCGNEELVRSLYLAAELKRRYGIPIRCALSNDTPGFTWGLAELFARAEVPYFSVAMNSFLSEFYATTTLPQLFYLQAQGDPGNGVLMWRCIDKQYAYLEGALTVGVYGNYSYFETKLTALLNSLEAGGYPYTEVLINCATGDNGAPNYAIVGNALLWNQSHASARVRIATMSEFFDSVSAKYPTQIPVVRGDAPNWWSWSFASSATLGMATSRAVQDLLPQAEAWATIAASVDRTADKATGEMQHAYVQNLLYEDHNLGATNPSLNAPYWAEKMGWIDSAQATGTRVRDLAIDQLSGRILTGADPVVAVFNGLAWPRTAVVDVELSDPVLASLGRVDVVDNVTQQPVTSQVVAGRWLAFLATDVPSFGYRVFRLVQNPSRPWGSVPLASTVLENEFYRVSVNASTGGIASVTDKQAARELTAGDGQFGLYRYNSTMLPSGLSVVASDSGALVQSLSLEGSAPGSSDYSMDVRLTSGEKAIGMTHVYTKLPPTTLESVDFYFSTSLGNGDLHYEIPFGSVRLFADELSGFRVNHYAVHRWLNVRSASDDLNLTLTPRTIPMAAFSGTTFSGPVRMLSSFNDANSAYRAGTGENTVQFRLTSDTLRFDPVRTTRFGLGASVPLAWRTLPAAQEGELPADEFSFMTVTPAELCVTALKGASDGDGMILRIFNPSTTTVVAADLAFAYPLSGAAQVTTLLEENRYAAVASGNTISLVLEPLEVRTLRFRLSDPASGVDAAEVPSGFQVEQNYPNPFNAGTIVRYTLGSPARVRYVVRNVLGQTVYATPEEDLPAGSHAYTWSGTSGRGQTVASGVYFYTIEATSAGRVYRSTRSMVFLR